MVTNGQITEYYEEEEKLISVEKGVVGNDLDVNKTKGGCLGFTIIKSKLAGASDRVEKDICEDPFNFFYPPTICMLQLDGVLKWWSYYNDDWREDSLL